MVKILNYIFFLAINTVLSIPNLYDNVNLYVEEPEPEVQRTIHGVKGYRKVLLKGTSCGNSQTLPKKLLSMKIFFVN